MVFRRPPRTIQSIAFALGCPTELGKSLFLKTPCTLDPRCVEIKLVLIRKLPFYPLALIVLEGAIQAAGTNMGTTVMTTMGAILG